jgi:hypothetical protein
MTTWWTRWQNTGSPHEKAVSGGHSQFSYGGTSGACFWASVHRACFRNKNRVLKMGYRARRLREPRNGFGMRSAILNPLSKIVRCTTRSIVHREISAIVQHRQALRMRVPGLLQIQSRQRRLLDVRHCVRHRIRKAGVIKLHVYQLTA